MSEGDQGSAETRRQRRLRRRDAEAPMDASLVEAALRGWLDGGGPLGDPEYLTGSLSVVARLHRDVYARAGFHYAAQIDQLYVASVEADAAVAALDATIRMVPPGRPGSSRRWIVGLRGPVTLRRTGETWRIEDLRISGERTSSRLFTVVSGAGEMWNVCVTPLAAALLADRTVLYLKIDNGRSAAVRLDRGILERGAEDLGGRIAGPVIVAAGGQEAVAAEWSERMPPRTRKMRLRVQTIEEGTELPMNVELRLRLRGRRHRVGHL